LVLRGLAAREQPPVDQQPLGPRFLALALYPTSGGDPDQLVPFAPVSLQPGGMVDLVVLGMAGSCAAAPDLDSGGWSTLEGVDLVYEQLTIVHTEQVTLKDPVNVWRPDQCP
jgi:hypothetical protein